MSFVAVAEVCDYRNVEVADSPIVQALIDQVEAHFLALTNRRDRPFGPAQEARVEIQDGSGGPGLYLDYPVMALTSLTLGYQSPYDETVAVADPAVLQWEAGSRRLDRVDGGQFGRVDQRRYVRVTYDAGADEPADAKLAIIRVVDALWRESGTEEATGERALGDSADLPLVADQDPVWRAAIASHWEPRLG